MEVPSHTDSNPPDSHSQHPTYWRVPITGIPTESGTRKRYPLKEKDSYKVTELLGK